jgi:3-deoxy-manno-octulosonate cytidylyltransferase (CMP-KDO synthetase)
MTSGTHVSGTDRIAELAASLPCDIIVGVQGDEPLLDAAVIDATVAPLIADPSIEMGTAARPARAEDEIASPHVVKVVCDTHGFALYFSRAPVPYGRDRAATDVTRVHVGLYAYRRSALLRLASLAPAPLEQAEMLEQLRALEHGMRIRVAATDFESFGVDTLEDLERVRQRLLAGSHR